MQVCGRNTLNCLNANEKEVPYLNEFIELCLPEESLCSDVVFTDEETIILCGERVFVIGGKFSLDQELYVSEIGLLEGK